MRLKMMWIRGLTATVLFLMLAQVNVWGDTNTHLVLAVGYRAFLLGAPVFLFIGLNGGMRAALAFSLVGTIGCLYAANPLMMVIFALGMAVSGYLAKSISAHTSRGAADNKISLNVGSLASGILLMITAHHLFLIMIAVLIMLVTVVLSFQVNWNGFEEREERPFLVTKPPLEFLPLFGWMLIGIATGIKLTGIFTILPQYLIGRLGSLPYWYGSLIIVNSLVVIFLQHGVMRFLDRAHGAFTGILSLSAMVLLALPALARVEHIFNAVLWILCLTIGECALSHYDRIAKEQGYLFPKELMVGVGSFIAVALSRNYVNAIYWSGLVGSLSLILGIGAVIWSTAITRIGARCAASWVRGTAYKTEA